MSASRRARSSSRVVVLRITPTSGWLARRCSMAGTTKSTASASVVVTRTSPATRASAPSPRRSKETAMRSMFSAMRSTSWPVSVGTKPPVVRRNSRLPSVRSNPVRRRLTVVWSMANCCAAPRKVPAR
ncbi:hypothetical protein G6F31_021097 [Rhizopus arrhizus]|nr:hypothetical protein G6F31_021097 [Rhizopus arrhizus]